MYKNFSAFFGLFSVIALFSLAAGLSGCNEDQKIAALAQYSHLQFEPKLKGTDQFDLFLDDMIAMKDLDVSAGRTVQYREYWDLDAKAGENVYERFSEIFGGVKASDVYRYLDERIHYLVKDDFTNTIKFKYNDWVNDPDEEKKLKTQGGQVGAANIGTQLWLQSAVDASPEATTFPLGGHAVVIDSSRTGVFILGDGYTTSTGVPFVGIPAEVRQSIVVHEARHSDCTGGITEQSLKELRGYRDYHETQAEFEQMSCGHLHAECPAGHSMAGLPACDSPRDIWGAYAVQAIFLESLVNQKIAENKDSSFTLSAFGIMSMMAMDSYDRLLYNAADLRQGKLGKIDLSSSGITK
jgi:hypothetical protein